MQSIKLPNNGLYSLELFSGSGHISNALSNAGFNTFSIDIRKRKGICEPDFVADINKLKYPVLISKVKEKYPDFNKFSIIWASVPCEKFSIAANGKHFDTYRPKTDEGVQAINLLKKTISIIKKCIPDLYFIENPRGNMKYNKILIDFLTSSDGMTKLTFWNDYGFPTPKPTNIFTNYLELKLSKNCKYGRGAKCNVSFDSLTTNQRQSIPALFCSDFANQVSTYFSNSISVQVFNI